jgi:ferredoxin-NADP reductase
MAGTALRRRLTWQVARVSAVSDETASVRTIMLDVPDWPGHQAGQHLGIRLTDEDGYVAERSYSIASAPGEPVAITVERLDDGEVSPYLTDELRVGDDLEMRGPIGGYFIWEPEDGGPLLLLAGGSGGGGWCRCGLSSGTASAPAVPSRFGCCTRRGRWTM